MNYHSSALRSRAFPLSGPMAAVGMVVLTVAAMHLQGCSAAPDQAPQSRIVVSSQRPLDINGGASGANLAQATEFAWTQMIAMNWAAAVTEGEIPQRGLAADSAQAPALNRGAPRVWQTLRAKTEVFPGIGLPHGASEGTGTDFGYDRPPLYRYDPAAVGRYRELELGLVPACEEVQANGQPPWIELSEAHEVGPEKMFAGSAPAADRDQRHASQRVLYAVNVSRPYYRYIVARGWYGGGDEGSTVPAGSTAAYVAKHQGSPPADSDALVGFPNGSIQIKTAWRKLNPQERESGGFVTAIARSYEQQDPSRRYAGESGNAAYPCYIDSEWGLVAMHFQTRTPSAPYDIWSTFEYSDNLLTVDGQPVEDAVGRELRNLDQPPTEPALTVRNASAADPPTPDTIQSMSPRRAHVRPGRRIYYENLSGTPTTQGTIAVNRRTHAIPEPVVAANEKAHAAIRQFLDSAEGRSDALAPALLHYKLVGIQWRPADKPVPGQNLVSGNGAADEVLRYPGIYYLANQMLETSYRLQNYSGIVQSRLPAPNQNLDLQDLITDFEPNGSPAKNVLYRGPNATNEKFTYNMGGCMGCHGQMQQTGFDFSFIFRRGRINAPEMDAAIRTPLAEMVYPKNHN